MRRKLRALRSRTATRAIMALVVAAALGGGFTIHNLLAYALDHYHAAATASDLSGQLGQVVGINYEIINADSLNQTSVAEEAALRKEVNHGIAVLEHSGYDRAGVRALANQASLVFAGLDTSNQLIGQGLVSGSDELQAATMHNDQILDVLMSQVQQEANHLRAAADRAGLLTERGIIAIGVGVLAAVAFLLSWYGRRRRRKASEDAERKSLERFEAMVEQSSDLSMVTAATGRQTYVSPSIEHILGYSRDVWSNVSPRQIVHPEDVDVITRMLGETVEGGHAGPADCRVRHADGSWRVLEVRLVDLTNMPSVGGILWNARDVTERRRLEAELERTAFQDSLTGLANRALFRDRLNHAVSRGSRQNRTIAVLLADVDGFKAINDSLGHDAGDEALREVAGRLAASVRPSDTVARIGGDEFTILLEDVGAEEAEEIAARVQQVMRQPLEVAGREIRLTVSIGIAQSGAVATTGQELLRNADMAMYSAKNAGKARFASYEPAMFVRAEEDLHLIGELDGALARGEMEVHYQPTYALGTEEVEGVEALVRWRHPERGMVPPASFIPLAEQTGQIVPIGLWVLEEACRQARAWQVEFPGKPPLTVGINLSGRQLADEHIVADVAAAIAVTGVTPSSVMLEITESVLMQDVDAVTDKLSRLKGLGIRLAIDDFGTGYSSLAYLRQFPVDVLKIDRAFVEAAVSDAPGGKALVQAIVDMGSSLHLSTIAEGIERQEQAEFLLGLGCGLGQGYLFARPMPAEDLGRFLASHPRSVGAAA